VTSKNNRIIEKPHSIKTSLRRPKGKRFFPVTITLTQKQIDYLQKQPNASKLIREILDDLINARENIERDLPLISLQKQMIELENQAGELQDERDDYVGKTDGFGDYLQYGEHKTREELFRLMTLKPGAPDDVKVAFKIVRECTNAIKKLHDEIDAIKKRIIESE